MTASRGAVFLSYSSEDADVAQRICTSLRDAGIEVWFDQSALRGGDAWDAEIRQQIRSCSLCIPVISASTCARAEGYFRLEWKLAVDRTHLMAAEKAFIVPVVIDGTRESTALVPDKFRAVQWTRLINQDDTQGLVAQVQRLLVREPQTEPGIRPVETGTAIALGAYGAAGIRGKPSIAVLPFTNMSGDPEQDYFADGMVEDIITALSRFNQLFVIARNSSFIEQVQDYTNYSHAYQAYYQCAFPPATAQTRCIPPSLIRRLQLKTGLGLIP